MEPPKDWTTPPTYRSSDKPPLHPKGVTMKIPPEFKDKQYTIDFKCPSCGNNSFCMVEEAYIKTTVKEVWEEAGGFEYELEDDTEPDYGSSQFLKYSCPNCNYSLPNNNEDLFFWLFSKGMLKEI
jgi:hypothetical protein